MAAQHELTFHRELVELRENDPLTEESLRRLQNERGRGYHLPLHLLKQNYSIEELQKFAHIITHQELLEAIEVLEYQTQLCVVLSTIGPDLIEILLQAQRNGLNNAQMRDIQGFLETPSKVGDVILSATVLIESIYQKD